MLKALTFIYCLCFSLISMAESSQVARLDTFISELESQQSSVQGTAVAIIIDGEIVYKKSFGYKDPEKTMPINNDTLFALASTSKPIISTAISLLVSQGKIDFNDKVKLTFLKSSTSMANFLSHTTGYKVTGNSQIESGNDKEKLINFIRQKNQECKPGKCYKYSNLMYSFIDDALKTKGSSIKKAIELLNEKIGTTDITLLPIAKESNFANQYSRNGKLLAFPSNYQKSVPAAAGVFASINSMTEFLKLTMGSRPEILNDQVLSKIFTPIVENKDIFLWNIDLPFENNRIKSYYGLGWRILFVDNKQESRLIFHSGFINGATTFMGFVPDKKAGIIVLVNQTSPFAMNQGFKFWAKVLKM